MHVSLVVTFVLIGVNSEAGTVTPNAATISPVPLTSVSSSSVASMVTSSSVENDNSTKDCTYSTGGICQQFQDILLTMLGHNDSDQEDANLINMLGLNRDQIVMTTLPTPVSIVQILQSAENGTWLVSSEEIDKLSVQYLSPEETLDALHMLYTIIFNSNTSGSGLDRRVVALLFKMSEVSFFNEDLFKIYAESTSLVIEKELSQHDTTRNKEENAVKILQSMERMMSSSNVSIYQEELDEFCLTVNTITLGENDVIPILTGGNSSEEMFWLTSSSPGQGRISSVLYYHIHQMLPGNKHGALRGGVLASRVLSVVVQATDNSSCDVNNNCGKYYHDLDIHFTLPYFHYEAGAVQTRWCVYWKFYYGLWSEEGCRLVRYNATHTTCTCKHLSTFAVLVTFIKPPPISQANAHLMAITSIVGCSLSIAGLVITLFTYIYLRILHRERILIHGNLALALLLAQVFFLASDYAYDNEVACKVMAICLHFLFLASFTWMLVEGVALYRTCTRGLLYACDMRLKFALTGWGIPLIIVLISLGVDYPQYGHGLENSCWLSVEGGLIWAFIAPMLVIVILNLFTLGLVIRVFLALKANSQKSEAARIRKGLRAMVMLLPLLGTTWLLSLLVPLGPTFSYLFITCNSLQGLMIFVLHCLCNEEVRRFMARKRRSRSRTPTSQTNLSVVWRHRSPEDDMRGFNRRHLDDVIGPALRIG